MKVLRWRGWISLAVLGVLTWLLHGLALAFLLLPPAYDAWYHYARDKRFRYVPFKVTRRLFRLLFLPRQRPGPAGPAVIPEDQRASAHWSPMVKAAIIQRDGNHCQCAGCPRCLGSPCSVTYDLQIDHVIPRSRGGASTIRNGRQICGPCNRYKSNKMPLLPS